MCAFKRFILLVVYCAFIGKEVISSPLSFPRAIVRFNTDKNSGIAINHFTNYNGNNNRIVFSQYHQPSYYLYLKEGYDMIHTFQATEKKSGNFSITNLLISINLIVFLIIKKDPHSVYTYCQSNQEVSKGQIYRLLSAVFAHQGYFHFAANMLTLFVLGNDGAKLFGSFRFLILYLFSGIGGSIFTYLLNMSPLKLGSEHTLGASGAIYGIDGATLMYKYRNRDVIGKEKKIQN
jgi:membrane associated rhomboid family serine protease